MILLLLALFSGLSVDWAFPVRAISQLSNPVVHSVAQVFDTFVEPSSGTWRNETGIEQDTWPEVIFIPMIFNVSEQRVIIEERPKNLSALDTAILRPVISLNRSHQYQNASARARTQAAGVLPVLRKAPTQKEVELCF